SLFFSILQQPFPIWLPVSTRFHRRPLLLSKKGKCTPPAISFNPLSSRPSSSPRIKRAEGFFDCVFQSAFIAALFFTVVPVSVSLLKLTSPFAVPCPAPPQAAAIYPTSAT